MEKFDVMVRQDHIVEYVGYVTVEAETPREARDIVRAMSQTELEDRTTDWEQADDIIDCKPSGDITITGYEPEEGEDEEDE